SAPSTAPGAVRLHGYLACRGSGRAGRPHPPQGRCGDVLDDYVRRNVSGMRVLRRRAGWTVRPWRRAVAVACAMLLVAAMTAAWALLLLHIAYWRTPTPEPVTWICPAE